MVRSDENYDYWTQRAAPLSGRAAPSLNITQINGVIPLDAQFGADPPKTVPDALFDVLFAQPAPTPADLAMAGGDPTKVLPMQTYAILDAAKLVNLPEMLETSGLEHRCMFKGAAYDDMKNVAPWIVRLETGNTCTRNLFTRSDTPWHLWDKEPGLYLRSRSGFDDMWTHFRKFTKVQDEDSKWYYWRFWEPKWFMGQLANMQPAQIDRFLPPHVHAIVVLSSGKVEIASTAKFDE